MIDPVVSLQPATHRQYFVLALSLPLRWLRVTQCCFKYHDCVKRVIYQASDIAKRLSINVLVIL